MIGQRVHSTRSCEEDKVLTTLLTGRESEPRLTGISKPLKLLSDCMGYSYAGHITCKQRRTFF